MNLSKGESLKATVYQACNDEFRNGVILDQSKIKISPWHEVSIKDNKLDLVIDRDAEDYNEIFKSQGQVVPPDEILESHNTTGIKIPIRARDEFPQNAQLPSSDLLKSLHYRMSKIVDEKKEKRAERSLDETALLALGFLVERWADSIIDATAPETFAENSETSDLEEDEKSEVAASSEDENRSLAIDNNDIWPDMDSD